MVYGFGLTYKIERVPTNFHTLPLIEKRLHNHDNFSIVLLNSKCIFRTILKFRDTTFIFLFVQIILTVF